MDIIARVQNMLLSPVKEWGVIKGESRTVKNIFTSYAIFLALIPSVCGFIGFSFLGSVSIVAGISYMIVTYVMALISVFILGHVIDLLAPSFSSTKDISASMKVAVFSSTPAWVFGVFNLFPSLSFIPALAGLFSLVLMYLGLKIVKSSDKVLPYFIVVLIVFIVLYLIAGTIVGILMLGSMATSIQ